MVFILKKISNISISTAIVPVDFDLKFLIFSCFNTLRNIKLKICKHTVSQTQKSKGCQLVKYLRTQNYQIKHEALLNYFEAQH